MSVRAESSSGRRGRRTRRVEVAKAGVIEQLPWTQPVYTDPPTEPLDEDGLEAVHDAAMRIVEEIGIDFLHEDARRVLKEAGCEVQSGSPTVRMDRAFVMEQVEKAPEYITLEPRNPDRTLIFGGAYAIIMLTQYGKDIVTSLEGLFSVFLVVFEECKLFW